MAKLERLERSSAGATKSESVCLNAVHMQQLNVAKLRASLYWWEL